MLAAVTWSHCQPTLPDIRILFDGAVKNNQKNNDRKSLFGFECITACKISNENYLHLFSDMHNNSLWTAPYTFILYNSVKLL